MIHYNLPFSEYEALTGLNHSKIAHIDRSPAHFQHAATTSLETDSLTLGRAAHTLLLEPEKFEQEFFVGKKFDRRTNAGKAAHAAQIEEAGDRQLLTEVENATAQAMLANLQANPVVAKLLSMITDTEVTIEFRRHMVDCKARLDAIADGLIVDLKTTKDASPREFERSAVKYNYWTQQEWYQHAAEWEGLGQRDSVIIAVENVAPYAVACYSLKAEHMTLARKLNQERLFTYRKCLWSGEWPGYENKITQLQMPTWAAYQLENLETQNEGDDENE